MSGWVGGHSAVGYEGFWVGGRRLCFWLWCSYNSWRDFGHSFSELLFSKYFGSIYPGRQAPFQVLGLQPRKLPTGASDLFPPL